jgi:hypothetical protein
MCVLEMAGGTPGSEPQQPEPTPEPEYTPARDVPVPEIPEYTPTHPDNTPFGTPGFG